MSCWVCDSGIVNYTDVLGMEWCTPCLDRAEAEAEYLREKSEW